MYTVDYFIKKFEAIPEEKWFTGLLCNSDDSARCALGHCLGRGIDSYFNDRCRMTEEATALSELFTNAGEAVARINDGHIAEYPQDSAKKRILAALYDIKKMQEVSVQPSYPDITKELAVLNEFKEIDVVQKPVKTFQP